MRCPKKVECEINYSIMSYSTSEHALCRLGPESRRLYYILYEVLSLINLPEPLIWLIFGYDEGRIDQAKYAWFSRLNNCCYFSDITMTKISGSSGREVDKCVKCWNIRDLTHVALNILDHIEGGCMGIRIGYDLSQKMIRASLICKTCVDNINVSGCHVDIERKNGILIPKNQYTEWRFICVDQCSIIISKYDISMDGISSMIDQLWIKMDRLMALSYDKSHTILKRPIGE